MEYCEAQSLAKIVTHTGRRKAGWSGQQGYGYNVRDLYDGISEILGLDTLRHMVIIGAGNIGRAIAGFPWNKYDGFTVDGIYDNSPNIIGQSVNQLTVGSIDDLKKFLKKHTPDVGVIATTEKSAQESCDILVAGGVKGIWAFVPTVLNLPGDVHLKYVHLNDSLHELIYYITQDV